MRELESMTLETLVASTTHCQQISCNIRCCLGCARELASALSGISNTLCAHVCLRAARFGCKILLEYQILLRCTAATLIIFIKFNSTSVLTIFSFEEMNDLSGPILLLQEIVLSTILESECSGL